MSIVVFLNSLTRKSSSERDGFNRFHSHGMQPSDVMRANADSISGKLATIYIFLPPGSFPLKHELKSFTSN
jgi:hypothetical protein